MEDQKYRDEEDLAEKLEGLKSKPCCFYEAQGPILPNRGLALKLFIDIYVVLLRSICVFKPD